MRRLSAMDDFLGGLAEQVALASSSAPQSLPKQALALPVEAQDSATRLSKQQRNHAAGLMRVNHVGEVCAQALYSAQALTARSPQLQQHYMDAAQQERAHLQWTLQRITALGSRPSLLNPLWGAGAFGLGLVAGFAGDQRSLGFVVETERQVEQHLHSHLEATVQGLPEADVCSRVVVQTMKEDEAHHALDAQALGAERLPEPVKFAMRAAAKIMTTLAYRI